METKKVRIYLLLFFVSGFCFAGETIYDLGSCPGLNAREVKRIYMSIAKPRNGRNAVCPVDMNELELSRDIISEIVYERDLRLVTCSPSGNFYGIDYYFNPELGLPHSHEYTK